MLPRTWLEGCKMLDRLKRKSEGGRMLHFRGNNFGHKHVYKLVHLLHSGTFVMRSFIEAFRRNANHYLCGDRSGWLTYGMETP